MASEIRLGLGLQCIQVGCQEEEKWELSLFLQLHIAE